MKAVPESPLRLVATLKSWPTSIEMARESPSFYIDIARAEAVSHARKHALQDHYQALAAI